MRVPFKGVINVDVRDSTPDWSPFEPQEAPQGAPNVLYIVLDDVGVGRQAGEPVTDDYPGDAPYSFAGGTLHQVRVNVSGEPYVDLERHAEMMLRSQ